MSESKKVNVSLRPSELVVAAIHNLEEEKGSSPNDIINFVSNKYDLDAEQVKTHVQKALKRGVCFGVLSENDGLYKLMDLDIPKLSPCVPNKRRTQMKKKAKKCVKGGRMKRKSNQPLRTKRAKKSRMEMSGRPHLIRYMKRRSTKSTKATQRGRPKMKRRRNA